MTAIALAPVAGARALARLDDWLGRRVSMRSLALLRVLVGPIVVLHLWPFLSDARAGSVYRDHFHDPYVGWYPDLPRDVYIAALWAGVVAAVAMTIGLAARIATLTTFAIVTYNVFLSTTHFHHNRAYLIIVLAALAVAPCGRELSVDAWWRDRRRRPPLDPTSPGWPLWLLRFEAVVVYGASGLSKLLDEDWFGGTVTWHRFMLARDRLDLSPMPGWAVALLSDRSFHAVAAKVIVATELFIAVGLCWRATRLAAVWIAVCFHVSIELTAPVQVFSYLAIAALVIWATPSTRDRVLVINGRQLTEVATGARLARSLPHRGRTARLGGPRPRTRRHRPHRPARRRARRQPAPIDRVVRVAGAAAAERPARSTGRPPRWTVDEPVAVDTRPARGVGRRCDPHRVRRGVRRRVATGALPGRDGHRAPRCRR